MAVWTEFSYDDPIRSYRRGMHWVPPGAGKPAIIYCAGHGWAGRDPLAFYDPTVGDPFFLNQIEPKEGSNPVACFAIWTASAAYDFTAAQPQWATATPYTQGDLVRYGLIYRCIETHTSDASTQPSVGGSWPTRWYLCDDQEIADHLTIGARHRTPAFRESNQLDLQAVYAHIVENAEAYGVDPGLIVVMGASAGGQQAGTFAYDVGTTFSSLDRPILGAPYVPTNAPKPIGAILRVAPNDFTWFPWGVLMGHLFGREFTSGEWAEYSARRKAALSPLGVLKSTRAAVPTFLAYGGLGFYNPATDVPPYSTVDYHHARNGYEMFQYLVGSEGQDRVVFVEDHPSLSSTYNVWESSAGIVAPSRTIADTEEDEEMWAWFANLTGA